MEVRVNDQPQVTFDQEPGSFYVGNLAALEHNVCHPAECKRTFDGSAATARGDDTDMKEEREEEEDMKDEKGAAVTAKGDQRLQIAVMIRSDVFRDCRARKIDSTPGPKEFFYVVNRAVAQHLAEVPVALPDLTEVLAEVARAGAGHLAD